MPLTFDGEDLQKMEYLMRLGLMEVHTQSAMMGYAGPDAPTRAENVAFRKVLVDCYTPVHQHMIDNNIPKWDK